MYTDITQKIFGHHARLKAGAHEGACMLLKHASETYFLVSTPTSTHEGHDKGAEQ